MSTNAHVYDLEERTFQFASCARRFLKRIPRTLCNIEDGKQLVRSSGSVGANYIEANESLGAKDFLMHIKIARKEAKESCYWLRLLDLESKPALEPDRAKLIQEALELIKILHAILMKQSR